MRRIREGKKLSQEQLAAWLQLEGLSINQKAISRIETDPEKLQQVYDLGLADGQAALPALNAYLAGQ